MIFRSIGNQCGIGVIKSTMKSCSSPLGMIHESECDRSWSNPKYTA